MSAAQHTPGLIKAFNLYATPEIRDQEENFIANLKDGSARAVADARRLVACWNACDGVPIEVLEARQAGGLPWNVADQIDQRAQRDELLAALKLGLEYWQHRQQRYNNRSPAWVQAARAAIAKATGSAA